MTDQENAAAGAMSAGIDMKAPLPTMSDIKTTAAELLAHIDETHAATEASADVVAGADKVAAFAAGSVTTASAI